jgi:hypothetical protein
VDGKNATTAGGSETSGGDALKSGGAAGGGGAAEAIAAAKKTTETLTKKGDTLGDADENASAVLDNKPGNFASRFEDPGLGLDPGTLKH